VGSTHIRHHVVVTRLGCKASLHDLFTVCHTGLAGLLFVTSPARGKFGTATGSPRFSILWARLSDRAGSTPSLDRLSLTGTGELGAAAHKTCRIVCNLPFASEKPVRFSAALIQTGPTTVNFPHRKALKRGIMSLTQPGNINMSGAKPKLRADRMFLTRALTVAPPIRRGNSASGQRSVRRDGFQLLLHDVRDGAISVFGNRGLFLNLRAFLTLDDGSFP
jgi:hypothetical protein